VERVRHRSQFANAARRRRTQGAARSLVRTERVRRYSDPAGLCALGARGSAEVPIDCITRRTPRKAGCSVGACLRRYRLRDARFPTHERRTQGAALYLPCRALRSWRESPLRAFATRQAQALSLPPRETFNDKRVGLVNPVGELVVHHVRIQDDRVPMVFVHVVAREDGRVLGAQELAV